MSPQAYQRNVKARAFDVARYLLCFGIPTGVGQVTSIRTLERQVRRLKASEYEELRSLAHEIAEACAANPAAMGRGEQPAKRWRRRWRGIWMPMSTCKRSREDLRAWARKTWRPHSARRRHGDCRSDETRRHGGRYRGDVALSGDRLALSRAVYELASSWSAARRNEVMDVALQSRTRRDELLRNFASEPYVFDIVMDIGAYRDLHRHRRCQQFRQSYSATLGFETPEAIREAGLSADTRRCYHKPVTFGCDIADARRVSICFRSRRGRAFSSRWILRRPNTSRGCVPE
jgi:hypothetical protein